MHAAIKACAARTRKKRPPAPPPPLRPPHTNARRLGPPPSLHPQHTQKQAQKRKILHDVIANINMKHGDGALMSLGDKPLNV